MITSDIMDHYIANGETMIDDTKGYEIKFTFTFRFMYIDLSNNNISEKISQGFTEDPGIKVSHSSC